MNPFSIKTPETLNPESIADLFIDVYSDFPRLLAPEHTFLHGARGTGKSMMLRYLEPQVQLAAHKVKSARELVHYAIHVPIKSPDFSLTELERLEGAPYWLLAQHFMLCNVSQVIVKSLKSINSDDSEGHSSDNFQEFYNALIKILKESGSETALDCPPRESESNEFLDAITNILKKEKSNAKKYMANIAFSREFLPYTNALYGYEEFFLPFIKLVKSLHVTPNGPIFLMIDDADNLPARMQKILNTWVSYRTTNDVCLKISTQQRYKTWRTTQDVLIESSHDFSEIDISTVYTAKASSHYYDRVEKIVQRRLKLSNIENQDPTLFFPEKESQLVELGEVKKTISANWDSGQRVSSRKSDDVTRYTTSEYMKKLALTKKTNTYSYAGFKSLVNISSGMIRHFLEPASRMYAELESAGSTEISSIPADTQDQVIYKWSEEYVLDEFDRLRQDESYGTKHDSNSRVEKLRNLINSLGECFQKKLVSNDSERRFISFMVTKTPPPEAQEVIDLAVEWGYLSVKSIARKEGSGRNLLYTINRRLAPYFKLDPSGYAAHMSLTPEHLIIALKDSQTFVRERLKVKNTSGNNQQSLDI